MAIVVENGDSKPALVYKNFFLDRLELTQRDEKDHTAPPYYVLNVQYRMFAIDENNTRHFKTHVEFIDIKDYAAVAYAKAIAGDPDLATAAIAIENALAKIIIDQKPELGTASVIA